MSSTTVSKRCKGCCFWQHYTGNIENPVMRKLHGQHEAPKGKPHACQLWLRDTGKVDDDGEPILASVFPIQAVRESDTKGPRFGERIGPHGTCDHHRAKNPPYRRPAPEVHIGVEHVVNHSFADVKLPDNAMDAKIESVVEMPPIAVDF